MPKLSAMFAELLHDITAIATATTKISSRCLFLIFWMEVLAIFESCTVEVTRDSASRRDNNFILEDHNKKLLF